MSDMTDELREARIIIEILLIGMLVLFLVSISVEGFPHSSLVLRGLAGLTA